MSADPVVHCRFCNARIVWAKLASGKTIPVDAEGGWGGNYTLEQGQDGTIFATPLPKGSRPSPDRHRVHFASCKAKARTS